MSMPIKNVIVLIINKIFEFFKPEYLNICICYLEKDYKKKLSRY